MAQVQEEHGKPLFAVPHLDDDANINKQLAIVDLKKAPLPSAIVDLSVTNFTQAELMQRFVIPKESKREKIDGARLKELQEALVVSSSAQVRTRLHPPSPSCIISCLFV